MDQRIQGEIRQVSRFSFAGAAGVFVYYALLYGLTEYGGVWYMGSATVAFVGNYTVNFFLHKFWTFRDEKKETVWRQLGQFTLVAVGGWTLNALLLFILVEKFHVWYMYAQVGLTVLVSAITYICLRGIFRPD